MGNCLKRAGGALQDNTTLLINAADPATSSGSSHIFSSPLPYNELTGGYYPASGVRHQQQVPQLQSTEMGIGRVIGVGLNLGGNSGGGGTLSEEEQQVRIAKRIGLIQHLPTRQFDGSKKAECVICMMELIVGEEVRYLPCMHTYHANCIYDWLLRSLTCPSCMEPVDAALINSYHPTT